MNNVIEPTVEADCTFGADEPFRLTSGGMLQPVTLRYALYGELNHARDNALLVCHALSGSARVADWWPQLMGRGQPFDTDRYCIIGVNAIGSCYGSTGPNSPDPQKSCGSYGSDFPLVTINDIVKTQARLLDHLGITRLKAVIGGSIGGMQALGWATQFPDRVEQCIAIGATLSSMGLALNHLQRQAIRRTRRGGRSYEPDQQPVAGLRLARGLQFVVTNHQNCFRSVSVGFRIAAADPRSSLNGRYDIAGYLDYQGSIFPALRRELLSHSSKAMDV